MPHGIQTPKSKSIQPSPSGSIGLRTNQLWILFGFSIRWQEPSGKPTSFIQVLKVNSHFSDLFPRKPCISKVLSTAKLFLQPARELLSLNNPHSSRKRFLTKSFYLLPVEAAGKCHLRVTRKKNKTKIQNRIAAIVAIQAFVIHVVALLSPAHSPLCQLQLLHFYPLHQNIKSVDL